MNSKLAPYQLFFPLGLLNAILAVGVWFVQNLGWFESPALFIHSRLIAGGFLWSFIVGFLMTAVPRMTGTHGANKIEYFFASALLLAQALLSFQVNAIYFYSNQMILILFLMLYGGRRVLAAKKPLPIFFSHVGVAMILGLLGSYYHAIGNQFMGTHLYHLGAVLLLVLGIGTRFFSFLSGLPSEFEAVTSRSLLLAFHGSAILVGVLLFWAGKGHSSSYFGLCFVSIIYVSRFWRIGRRSNHSSALKYGVRTTALMMPLSFLLAGLYPLMWLTWFHLIFIGSFGLLTLSVATRVTLAHGSYPLDLETKMPALWWLITLLILTIVSRVMYGFTDGLWKISFLHLAATFWIFAIINWGWNFLPKIFQPGPQSKPSC